jgi:hypothetical protein
VPNAHPPWALSDGITELYFESPEHLEQVFRSEWVRTKVGPDGANFSDFSAVLPMFVREEEVVLSGVSGSRSSTSSSLTPRQSEDPNTFVAVYFVAFRDGQAPASAEETVSQFAGSLQNHAGGEVAKLTVNVPAEAGFDLAAYFGGAGAAMPHYQFVFTVTLRGKESVCGVRRAQKEFEARSASLLDLASTWIAFGERAVVLDQTENIEVCLPQIYVLRALWWLTWLCQVRPFAAAFQDTIKGDDLGNWAYLSGHLVTRQEAEMANGQTVRYAAPFSSIPGQQFVVEII